MVHDLPLKNRQVQVQQYQAETERLRLTPQNSVDDEIEPEDNQADARLPRSKLETIPRPKIQSNSTQSDWGFFTAQWSRYVDGSKMTKSQQINQLWAACSEELQRSLHNGNSSRITEPALLLENIRIIAVKKLNNLVNIVEFQNLAQFNNETVTAFATRLSGHANLCDMLVTCSTCELDVSFKNKLVMFQFVKGLKDNHAQERILEASASEHGGELSLEKVVKLAESFEMGRMSAQLVNKGQVSKISEYQKGKQNSRLEKPNETQPNDKCGNCGNKGHTSKLNDRRKNCPAFDKTCTKCKTNGYFAAHCRGGPRETRDKSKSKDTKVN